MRSSGPSPWDDDDAKDVFAHRPANARMSSNKRERAMHKKVMRASAALMVHPGRSRRASGGSWTRRRRAILLRDNYRCVYCGEHADTVDHVHPKSLGGTDAVENLVAACEPCNMSKSSQQVDEWLASRGQRRAQ